MEFPPEPQLLELVKQVPLEDPYHEVGGLQPVAGQHPITVPQPPLLLVAGSATHALINNVASTTNMAKTIFLTLLWFCITLQPLDGNQTLYGMDIASIAQN